MKGIVGLNDVLVALAGVRRA